MILSGLGPIGGPPTTASVTGVQAYPGGAKRMVDVPSGLGFGLWGLAICVLLGAEVL